MLLNVVQFKELENILYQKQSVLNTKDSRWLYSKTTIKFDNINIKQQNNVQLMPL